jgi:hypothetical protein
MNMNKSYVSAENTPGQAASNPARHSSQQTSDVHSFGGPEEEVLVPPRQFVPSSVTILDNSGATLNEY